MDLSPRPTPCDGNDTDGDEIANPCDPADDNDGVLDGVDDCRLVANPTSATPTEMVLVTIQPPLSNGAAIASSRRVFIITSPG